MKKPFFASSESVEHYTPRYIWERAIRCMGKIDTDPASDPARAIPAAEHFTKKENGLSKKWGRCVWLNHPFDQTDEFFEKLEKEIRTGRTEEVIILWKSATETEAWRKLTTIAPCLVAFPHQRIEFLGGTIKGGKGSNFSPALIYIGPKPEKFIKEFSDIADIWKPISQNSKIKKGQIIIENDPGNLPNVSIENFPLQAFGVLTDE